MAREIYFVTLLMIAFAILWAGIVDVALLVTGNETISAWLKSNPAWFWVPAGLIVTFMILMFLHLFVLPPQWGGV